MNTNNRNNSNNNNRRRGRNNNRSQGGGGGGGGNQGNRIDSRARGNAPQMLEKYRKLAHDASLNGDRVQTEYYLQFADHYFRVIADSRVQKDDQRPTGQREREQQSNGDDFYDYEEDTDSRGRRFDTRREEEIENEAAAEAPRATEGEQPSADSDDENPFLRESRPRRPRGRERDRPAGEGQSRDDSRESQPRESQPRDVPSRDSQPRESRTRENPRVETRERAPEVADNGFDAGILPPSIARDEAPAAPKRAPRVRKPRKAEDGDAETLEAVG